MTHNSRYAKKPKQTFSYRWKEKVFWLEVCSEVSYCVVCALAQDEQKETEEKKKRNIGCKINNFLKKCFEITN